MSGQGLKVGALLAIWVLNLAASACPFWVTSSSWVSKADALAGGVFIGSALVHLIPESLRAFEAVSDRPLAPLVALACFALLLAVELLAGAHADASDSPELHRSSDSSWQRAPYATMSGRISSVSLVLYFVLLFHGFVEALALGVAESRTVLLALFCAVVGHKPVEAFALGLQLLRSRPTRATYAAMMGAFSSVAPLTILLTMELGRGAPAWFSAVVTAASAGAFLFVACHEVAELLHRAHKMGASAKITHIAFFVAGVAWMAAFGLLGEKHEH
jgi:zinc transporter 1/2/3